MKHAHTAAWASARAFFSDVAANPWHALRLSIRLSALSTFASLLLSRDLWFQQDRLYLPVPLVEWPWLSAAPQAVNAALYLFTLLCCVALFFAPHWRRIGFLLIPPAVFFVLQDHMRAQFFLYMYVFNLLAAAALPRKLTDADLDPLRYMTIGVYFWAGFYKLNAHFFQAIFPGFVAPWFPFKDVAIGMAPLVPLVEMGIAVCLLIPAARWFGRTLAAVMLVVVLLSIGPFGLNQAMPVWPTNVYLDCLAVFLFLTPRVLWNWQEMKKPLSLIAVTLFLLLPALGMFNALGHHQAFKLYCCPYYAEIQFAKNEKLSFLPEELALSVDRNNRLNSATITFKQFNVCSYPALPEDRFYLAQFKGFCPFLSRPKETRLHVLKMNHFWVYDMTENVYELCTPEQRLLETRRLTKHGIQ